MVRIPERQPERPVAAWASGAATRRRNAARRTIVDVKKDVALVAVAVIAGRRWSTRDFPPFVLLLALSPHVILGRFERVRSGLVALGHSGLASVRVELRERERKEVLIECRCLLGARGRARPSSRGDNWSSRPLSRDSPPRKRFVFNSALPCGQLKCRFLAPRCVEGGKDEAEPRS